MEGEDLPGSVVPKDEELEEDEEDEEGESGSEDDGEEGGDKNDLTRRGELASNEFFVDEIVTEGLPEGGEGVPSKVIALPKTLSIFLFSSL